MTKLLELNQKKLVKRQGSSAIEFGCGFGRNLKYVRENRISDVVYGIDQTEEALVKSRELLAPYIDDGSCILKRMDASKHLDFPDEVFDLAFDIMSPITFIPTQDARKTYFLEVRRVLKPGGVYLFLTGRAEG